MATWPMATSVIDVSPSQAPAHPCAGVQQESGVTTPAHHNQDQTAQRRKGAVRTAWVVGIIAIAVYVAFILSGVLAA